MKSRTHETKQRQKQTGKKDRGGWESWRKLLLLFQRKRDVRWRMSERKGEWVCSALCVPSLCCRSIDWGRGSLLHLVQSRELH